MSDEFLGKQDSDNAYTAPAEGEKPFQFTSRLQAVGEAPAPVKKQHSGLVGVIVGVVILLVFASAALVLVLRYTLTVQRQGSGFSIRLDRRKILDPLLNLEGLAEDPASGNGDAQSVPRYEWDGATLNVAPSRKDDALSYGQLYGSCAASIAILEAEFAGGDSQSAAAIVITEDGALIASTHVISGAEALYATVEGQRYSAYIVGLDYATDLAVLKIDAHGLKPAAFCGSEGVSVGDAVAVIGNPIGGVVNISDGILSAVNSDYSYRGFRVSVLQFTGQMGSVASGSALVNGAGQIIGIVNPDLCDESGSISFAISMQSANAVINELLQNGFVAGRPSSGLTVSELPAAYAAYYRYPSSLYISAVEEFSPAYEAGLRRGDLILEANGQTVDSVSELYAVINGLSAGDLLTLRVYREGETGEISFQLMEATSPRG